MIAGSKIALALAATHGVQRHNYYQLVFDAFTAQERDDVLEERRKFLMRKAAVEDAARQRL